MTNTGNFLFLGVEELKKSIETVLHLASETFGAHGGNFMIQSNKVGGPSFFASSSSQFLSQVTSSTSDPRMKIFFNMITSIRNSSGDSGWFNILLACKLIILGLEIKLSRFDLVSGLVSGVTLAEELLKNLSFSQRIPFNWSESTTILSLISSILRTKTSLQLSSDCLQHVTFQILTAFLSSIQYNLTNKLTPKIIYRKVPGLPPSYCTVYKNCLVLDIPIPIELIAMSLSNVRILLFDQSLEAQPIPTHLEYSNIKLDIRMNTEEHIKSPLQNFSSSPPPIHSMKEVEYEILRSFAGLFLRSGIGLICCQRRIHPFLIRLLKSHGVLCLPRLSVRYIQAMQEFSGAKILGSVSAAHANDPSSRISSDCIGFLASLRLQSLGSRNYVIAESTTDADVLRESLRSHPPHHSPTAASHPLVDLEEEVQALQSRMRVASTMVLAMPSEDMCTDLQVAVEGIVQVLAHSVSFPFVLPGAGCWQALLAHELRSRIRIALTESSSRGEDSSGERIAEPDMTDRHVFRGVEVLCEGLEYCARLSAGRTDVTAVDTTSMESTGVALDLGGIELRDGFRLSVEDIGVVDIDGVCYSSLIEVRSPDGCRVRYLRPRRMEKEDRASEESTGDPSEEEPVKFLQADVLDAYIPNLSAMKQAVEVATCILQIGGMIELKPEERNVDTG